MKITIDIPDDAMESIRDVAHAQGMSVETFIAVATIIDNCPDDRRHELIKSAIESGVPLGQKTVNQ